MKAIPWKNKYALFTLIFLIGLGISLIITFTNPALICGEEKGCDLVLQSKYSSTLVIKNSIYGIPLFALMSIITIMQLYSPSKAKRKIISLAIKGGALVALYFIYLQIFIIKAFCQYCLVIDISLLIALAISAITHRDLLTLSNPKRPEEPHKSHILSS